MAISETYNMDCLEGMKQYPDKYFELAIVDPPYGIGENGSMNKTRGKLAKSKDYKSFYGDDLNSPDIEYFNQLIRISKNQIIWGANHFISKIAYDSPCWIVWDKDNGLTDFADCELALTSFKTSVRKFKFKWQGMLQENMKNKEIRIHPTQKPVSLYKWILDKFAKENDKILDTHLGSGSSRIAAYDMGFDFIGYELDKDYFDAQEKRFNQFKMQTKLF
jgi:site-specific DNA-methyltransferase (adenine-specific)